MAHITLLQGIISRLADNSASCKTWCITLVSALISLAGAAHVPGIVTFALVPVVIFGFMDTIYLAQERAYRDLYTSTVRVIRDRTYTLQNVYKASASVGFCGFLSTVCSWSVLPLYLGLILAYIVVDLMGWLAVFTVALK